jgi:glyoxylase-like metal-dependent hydrolase (beta-lactamase superfamily II)
MQVQQIDEDTFVIRQGFSSSVQAPFQYLLFGTERALLIDTGDKGARMRESVDATVAKWLRNRKRDSINLVVAHSHAHSDHHAGDAAFADRPGTTIVGLRPRQVAEYFRIGAWPEEIVEYDLGARLLDVIPAPGHEDAHIVFYDRKTKLLFSGDVLLPGRILVPFEKFDTFVASVDRLATFAAKREITALLGGHIEMSARPGEAYEIEAKSHPNERGLELPSSALTELQTALHAMAAKPVSQPHDQFVIVPLPHAVLAPYELPPTGAL